MMELQTDPWALYIYSLKSPASKEKYPKRLAKFFAHIGLPSDKTIEEQSRMFVAKASNDQSWAFNNILKFVIFQLERVEKKEIVAATVRGYVKTIKLLCEVADLPIPWKKITRGIPRERRYADDRAPSIEEIRSLIEYPERRIKAIIYSMCSGGFRLGAWDYLRWGHVEPITRNDSVVAAKVTIYAGESEEYYTFISGEAYAELASWMKSREEAGEKITKDSWLMRDLWDTRVRRGQGKPATPKKLQSVAIKRLIERAHWSQGLRTKLPEGKKRHPYQAVHSLRKYFKTKSEAADMKPINVETLMGHNTGISDSYYRPTEKDLLEDYLRVVNALTISPTAQLYNEVEKLKVETKQMERMSSEIDMLKGKLSDNGLTLRTLLTAISELDEEERIAVKGRLKEMIEKETGLS